jgi:hypothetical protein
MKNLHENMNTILGIEGELIPQESRPVIIPKSNGQEKDIQTDYEYARGNLYGIIEQGSDALNSLLELAKASEHPRAFEVVSQLTKTLVDANKDLISIQKQVKELKDQDKTDGDVTNNNLFVGSTADLLKMIKDNDGK